MENMENTQYYLLDQITKATQNWRTKVTVISKSPWRTGERGTRYQRLILADEKGNAIDATIFGTDIEYYEKTITVDKTYVISNARVQDAVPMYNSLFANTNFSWFINRRTNVIEVQHPIIASSPFKRDFIDIGKCKDHIGGFIHTIVVIVEKLPITHPTENKTLHEYVAIDKGMEPIIVSFWDDTFSEERYSYLDNTENHPTVALIDFSVNTFHGLSLASTRRSILITALDDDRFNRLCEWFKSHKEEAMSKVNNSEFLKNLRSDSFPDFTAKEVHELDKNGKFYITATTTLSDSGQDFTYICCETCHSKSEAAVNTQFKCHKCKVQKFAKRRYKFILVAKDSTGELNVTVFGRHGRNIFGMVEDQFHSTYMEGTQIPLQEINTTIGKQESRMLIKPKLFAPSEKTSIMYYNVEKWPEFEHESIQEDSGKNTISGGILHGAKRRLTFLDENEPSCSTTPQPNGLNIPETSTVGKEIKVKIEEVEDAMKKAAHEKRVRENDFTQDEECVEIDIDTYEGDKSLETLTLTRCKSKRRPTRKVASNTQGDNKEISERSTLRHLKRKRQTTKKVDNDSHESIDKTMPTLTSTRSKRKKPAPKKIASHTDGKVKIGKVEDAKKKAAHEKHVRENDSTQDEECVEIDIDTYECDKSLENLTLTRCKRKRRPTWKVATDTQGHEETLERSTLTNSNRKRQAAKRVHDKTNEDDDETLSTFARLRSKKAAPNNVASDTDGDEETLERSTLTNSNRKRQVAKKVHDKTNEDDDETLSTFTRPRSKKAAPTNVVSDTDGDNEETLERSTLTNSNCKRQVAEKVHANTQEDDDETLPVVPYTRSRSKKAAPKS